MTKDGFSPQTATITPETKVIFENTGTNKHWPASDDHPSHTEYDGTRLSKHCAGTSSSSFDACDPVPPGDSWSFTFDATGSYAYHDHLWPHLTGKIVVQDNHEENDGIIARIIAFFKKLFYIVSSFFTSSDAKPVNLDSPGADDEYYQKLKRKYKKIVQKKDPGVAIQELKRSANKNDRVQSLCHDVIHEIGHTAYEKYASFEKAITYRSDYCNSGYLHGLFESYFRSASNPTKGLAEQCSSYASGRRRFDLWQCHHGIGHGFMYMTGGSVEKSLDLCEKHLEKKAVSSCQNGVLMEVFNKEKLANEDQFIEDNDPFASCANIRTSARHHCYLYVPTYLVQPESVAFSDVFEMCDQAPSFSGKKTCIRGVGSEALKRNMDRAEDIFDLCEQAGSFIYQSACVKGAISMVANQTGSLDAHESFVHQHQTITKILVRKLC